MKAQCSATSQRKSRHFLHFCLPFMLFLQFPLREKAKLIFSNNFPVERGEPWRGFAPSTPSRDTREVPWTQFRMQQTVSFIQFPGGAWGTMRGFTPAPHQGHCPWTRYRKYQFVSDEHFAGEMEHHAHTLLQRKVETLQIGCGTATRRNPFADKGGNFASWLRHCRTTGWAV